MKKILSKYWLWLLMIAAVLTALLYFAGSNSYVNINAKKQEIKQIQMEIDDLKQKRDSAENEFNRLTNDKEYLEKYARDEYQMKRDDETLFILR